jgi:hypothetical protein
MSTRALGSRIRKALSLVRLRKPSYEEARKIYDDFVRQALMKGMPIPVTWLDGWPDHF